MPDIINSDFFEAMLRQAVIKNNRDEIAAIPSDDELKKKYEFSERHNRKMKKLFAADSRHEVFTIIYRWGKVAVVAVCVSATLMFGTLLTSADVRKAIGDVVVTWFEKFTKFQSPAASEEFIERDWSPAYLPEGFLITNSIETNEIRNITYNNSNNARIIFSYRPSDFSTSVDNEDMEYSVMIENDIIYHLFEATNEAEEKIIVWDISGYRFTLTGHIEVNELFKMALSVE